MSNLLEIKLTDIEMHLFNGGWKQHHIVPDEVFKARQWSGYKVHTGQDAGSSTSYTDTLMTQHIEIIPGNHNTIYYWQILIDGKLAVEHRRFSTPGQSLLTKLVKNEGLTAYEFHEKFALNSDNVKYFSGQILHFREFKYSFKKKWL